METSDDLASFNEAGTSLWIKVNTVVINMVRSLKVKIVVLFRHHLLLIAFKFKAGRLIVFHWYGDLKLKAPWWWYVFLLSLFRSGGFPLALLFRCVHVICHFLPWGAISVMPAKHMLELLGQTCVHDLVVILIRKKKYLSCLLLLSP